MPVQKQSGNLSYAPRIWSCGWKALCIGSNFLFFCVLPLFILRMVQSTFDKNSAGELCSEAFFCSYGVQFFLFFISVSALNILMYRVTKKTEPINFFITCTKKKRNNSNFVHSNFWTCWWILGPQFYMHRIYFISWKKEKARIKFMNFSQKYMGSVFCVGLVGVTLYL